MEKIIETLMKIGLIGLMGSGLIIVVTMGFIMWIMGEKAIVAIITLVLAAVVILVFKTFPMFPK